MKKVIKLENVVKCESCIIRTYPMRSDYGCLTDAVRIIRKEGDEYVEECYVTEELIEGPDAYEIEVLSRASVDEWIKWKKSKRMGKNGYYAEPGDVIEIVKGRKHPIGSRFVVKESYTYYDRYQRPQAFYWITETGERVIKDNCVIVG